MKKLILTKTTATVQKPFDSSCSTLLDRKSMLVNYKKLFEALFDLPDKKVVARVLDAINSTEKPSPSIEVVQICSNCHQKTPKVIYIDASTQTEGKIIMRNSSAGNSDDSRDTPPISSTSLSAERSNKDPTIQSDDVTRAPIKRKRRRKVQIPQVIKKSLAQQQQERNKPILQKRKANVLKTNQDEDKKPNLNVSNNKRQRHDSVSSASTIFSDLIDEQTFDELVTKEDCAAKMLDEWMRAGCVQDDGLLPIHSAIVKDDCKYLKRQILVWKYSKQADLNELLTEDDEDCLQLAVVEKSQPDIVNILLSNGLNADCRDSNSNTIIHLAVLNEASSDVMNLLMEKIDLNSLFVLNYDGYTALHLAVRQNDYMLAEAILDALDRRVLGKPHYERKKLKDEKHFLNYYENCCERYKLLLYIRKYKQEHLRIKRRLMDAGDICSGNTTLLYAIENKLDHLIYFLIAHFSDPKAENLSGQSPTTFMNEFAKSLNLSLRIDQVMENLVFLLYK